MRKETNSSARLTCRLTPQEKERLDSFCADRGMKVSDFVRTAIVEKMEKMEDKK